MNLDFIAAYLGKADIDEFRISMYYAFAKSNAKYK